VTDADQPLASLSADLSPSSSLLANLRQELMRHPPFAQMPAGAVDFFLSHSRQNYFAPDEILLDPDSGLVKQLFFIRQGAVIGERGLAELSVGAFHYEPGELFPISAALAQRAVTATYRAASDTAARGAGPDAPAAHRLHAGHR